MLVKDVFGGGVEGGALEKCFYIPRAELATRSISTVFRASGLCLAFSFLLVAST